LDIRTGNQKEDPRSEAAWPKWPINHHQQEDSPVRNRALHFFQRTEAGFDGLARANLRFSEQGGP
jgi:hypothetical protein